MRTISRFFRDYYRLMRGLPLNGGGSDRLDGEMAGRITVTKYSRGNVATQGNMFASNKDLDRERDELTRLSFR